MGKLGSKLDQLGVCIFGVLVAGLIGGCGKGGDTAKAASTSMASPAGGDAKPALSVTLTQAHSENWPRRIAASGSVQAWQEAIVGAETSGLKLIDIRANVGDVVKKGQVLARFDEASVAADLAQQRATVAESEANGAQARLSAERAHALESSGAISRQDIIQYETSAKTSAARLASAKAQLTVQEIKLRYAVVQAPDDGIISSRSATLGTVAMSGTELFRLIRQGRLEWRAELRAEQLLGIQPGQRAEVTDATGALIRGKVRQVAPTVDATARNAMVYVDLPQAVGLKAGLFVSGHLLLPDSPALVLAQAAVVLRDGSNYAMKVGADHHVQQVKLMLGRREGLFVEVLSGLSADERVVATGAGFLNDGDLVQVVADSASAQASRSAGNNVANDPTVSAARPAYGTAGNGDRP